MKTQKSILSVHISTNLLKELARDSYSSLKCLGQRATISARKCGRHHTGGLTIKIWLDVKAGYSRGSKLTAYLRPGWTDETVHRAVARLVRASLLELQRVNYVVNLDDWIKANCPNLDFDKVEAEEIRSGRTSCYDTMTIEQADEWRAWLETVV